MTPTNDAPVTVEPADELAEMLQVGTETGAFDHTPEEIGLHVMENAQAILNRLAALASAPAADWCTSRGQTNLSALHHAERLLDADNAVEKIMAQSDEQLVADAMKTMSAQAIKVAIRGWLDADDASHWGAFETALDAAINETPERTMIVAMLRADAETMRANATAYSEESPTDARALHEVATTLGFKAAQIERGDHLGAEPASAPAGDGVAEEAARAYFERGFMACYAWQFCNHASQLSDAVIDHAWDNREEGGELPALARPRAAVGEREV